MTALACSTVRSPGVAPLHQDRLLLHLEAARLDGARLTGRLLLGVSSGTGATMEPDAWPATGLYVQSVKRCGEPTELPLFAQNCFGRLGPAPEREAPVRLKAGSWYGHDVDVWITDREPAPECVLVDALVPLNHTGAPGSQLRFSIQAHRNGQVRLFWPVDRRVPERTDVLRAGASP